MLELYIPAVEMFDDDKQVFVTSKPTTLRLEHSLVSISKWESRWKKPFLKSASKSTEETIDYIRCMTISQNVDPAIYYSISDLQIRMIDEYINDEKTATTFHNDSIPNRQVITSELIYYWMAAYNIPMECQKWHLSRLLTLIKIASIENSPKKPMSKRAILSQNRALNAARRKASGSRG